MSGVSPERIDLHLLLVVFSDEVEDTSRYEDVDHKLEALSWLTPGASSWLSTIVKTKPAPMHRHRRPREENPPNNRLHRVLEFMRKFDKP